MTLAVRTEDARLRPDEFRLLRDLVNGYAGIYFGDDALPMLERRVQTGERPRNTPAPALPSPDISPVKRCFR